MTTKKLFSSLSLAALTVSTAQAVVIGGIQVKGNERVEREAILSYVPISVGDNVSDADLDNALKSLYKTGLFVDVNVHAAGNNLVIEVEESAIINRIVYEGNSKLSDKVLKTDTLLRPRMSLNNKKIQDEVQRIQTLYRRQGRFAAKINPKVIKRDQGRVDVVFEITEGPVTAIRDIIFKGNTHFSERKLRGVISTKEHMWYRFWASDDVYDPERLEYDKDLLRQFYMDEGYIDFRINSAMAEMSDSMEDFFVTFDVEEGPRYKVSKVNIVSHIPEVKTEKLGELLTLNPGDWYSRKTVEEIVEKLTDSVGTQGYAFVDIQPEVERDVANQTVVLTLVINNAPKVYVNRVEFVGNTRTLDHVIRREMTIAEGDPFNASKIKSSQQRIRNLGFFKTAEVKSEPADTADKANVKVEVEEQSTGEIRLSGGYSTVDGPLVEFGFSERNFRGRGQEVSAKTVQAKRRKQYVAEFIEPALFNKNLAGGVSVQWAEQKNDDESSYDEISYGSTVSLGFDYTEFWNQQLTYTLEQSKITKIRNNASRFIREQAGTSTASVVGQAITYDRRDYRFEPTEGYYVTLGNAVAGAGGDVKYFRTNLTGGYYYSIIPDVVFGVKLHGGLLNRMGKPIRVTDRFFLGADSLRGFAHGGVSPRDKTGNEDALGGLKYYAGTAEVSFPIGLPNEFGVKGSAFVDAGTVWDVDRKDPNIVDEKKLRASAGVGVSWKSPFGPLRIDFAKPFRKGKYDKVQEVLFGFRTSL